VLLSACELVSSSPSARCVSSALPSIGTASAGRRYSHRAFSPTTSLPCSPLACWSSGVTDRWPQATARRPPPSRRCWGERRAASASQLPGPHNRAASRRVGCRRVRGECGGWPEGRRRPSCSKTVTRTAATMKRSKGAPRTRSGRTPCSRT
jgi:hypothetical protein